MRKDKTMAILLIAILMTSIFAIFTYAIEGTHLTASGDPGTEDRIVIDMPTGFKLGNLESIAWSEYLVAGYPPHVDVILDLDGDGDYDSADDALVFEYAYNYVSHALTEAPMPYGALTDAWYQTFSDDGDGPAAVTDSSMAWATKGAPGPLGGEFGDANFFFVDLAHWKEGQTYTASGQVEKTINSDSIVLRIEIEVDNWVVDSEVYVDDVVITHDFVPSPPPAPKKARRSGVVSYGDMQAFEMTHTLHKLIAVTPIDSDVNYNVTVTLLSPDGDVIFDRTYRMRASHQYLALYLSEISFPDNYIVVVSSSIGYVPYVVASRFGIERSG